MLSIGVQNLRSLYNIDEIEIKPITVLLGKNSAGKSTFLRMFPLLKQSIEERTSEPILWYGDYVDFGDFEESKCKNINKEKKDEDTINFSFRISISERNREYNRRYRYMPNYIIDFDDYYMSKSDEENEKNISIKIYVAKKNIRAIDLFFEDQSIKIEFPKNGSSDLQKLYVNDTEISIDDFMWRPTNNLIPLLVNKGGYYSSHKENTLYTIIKNLIIKVCGEQVENEELDNMICNLPYFGSRESILKSLQQKQPRSKRNYKAYKSFANLSPNSQEIKDINNYWLAFILPSMLEVCSQYLSMEFSNITYSKPLRADIQRYYRVQGLGVDEIDPSGQNMPMFINNLQKSELLDFQEWTKTHFGISFEVTSKEGHVSLMIKDDSNHMYNLADEGVGYSQVLPIITNLWIASRNKNISRTRYSRNANNNDKLILIEQPELHIHPAFQGQLVDAFSEIANQYQELRTKIIFETHSETMLNRLGYLISKQKLDPSLVNVVLFQKDETGNSVVEKTGFDKDGFLENWPIDFFSTERIVR